MSNALGELLFNVTVAAPFVLIAFWIVHVNRRRPMCHLPWTQGNQLPRDRQSWAYEWPHTLSQHPTDHENYGGTPPPRHLSPSRN